MAITNIFQRARKLKIWGNHPRYQTKKPSKFERDRFRGKWSKQGSTFWQLKIDFRLENFFRKNRFFFLFMDWCWILFNNWWWIQIIIIFFKNRKKKFFFKNFFSVENRFSIVKKMSLVLTTFLWLDHAQILRVFSSDIEDDSLKFSAF